MIVVADTGPVNYLVLSGQLDLAHALYGALLLPPAVHRELLQLRSPATVRQWALTLPAWAEVRSPRDAARFTELGPGEREAIALALEMNADSLLIDETAGRRTAVENGVPVKGTLGLLEEAANRNLVDLAAEVGKLKATRIFLADEIVQGALKRQPGRAQPRKPRLRPPAQ
jgi:predicted nucleic acid-binding protein